MTFSGGLEGGLAQPAVSASARADAQSVVQNCMFCFSADWQWFRYLGAATARARQTLPQFVVTCGPCEALMLLGDRIGLAARVEAVDPGESGELLAMLDAVLIAAGEPRDGSA